jgi:hypothetical protein
LTIGIEKNKTTLKRKKLDVTHLSIGSVSLVSEVDFGSDPDFEEAE